MQQVGIQEKLITQLVEHHLDRDRFFVGERKPDAASLKRPVSAEAGCFSGGGT